MRVICEPSLRRWEPAFAASPDRSALSKLLSRAPVGAGASCRVDRVIATGHQPWLWHPGILAKDLAMVQAARRFQAGALHVVVDHDLQHSLELSLPVLRDGRLRAWSVRLAQHDAAVPTGSQPPVDEKRVVRTLIEARDELGSALLADLEPVIEAYDAVPPGTTLAEQTSAVLARLARPYTGPLSLLFSTHLEPLPGFQEVRQHMVDDARHCAQCYNHAVAAYPESGVVPLAVDRDRVELPLWVLRWRQPRRRVFTSLLDPPLLVESNGRPIETGDGDGDCRLVPKALLLTALIRSYGADLFIHGTGGALYDRVTERWWAKWLGRKLAPMALVTADLTMSFDVPVSTHADLDRVLWWRHHLPHNLDRALKLDDWRTREKRRLLEHMADDRDRTRRAAVFARIHEINRELAVSHRQELIDAEHRVRRARAGAANRQVAVKRDWSFALYAPNQLKALSSAFS